MESKILDINDFTFKSSVEIFLYRFKFIWDINLSLEAWNFKNLYTFPYKKIANLFYRVVIELSQEDIEGIKSKENNGKIYHECVNRWYGNSYKEKMANEIIYEVADVTEITPPINIEEIKIIFYENLYNFIEKDLKKKEYFIEKLSDKIHGEIAFIVNGKEFENENNEAVLNVKEK